TFRIRGLRSSGFFFRHGPTRRSTIGLPDGGAGVSVRLAASAPRLSPSKALRPVIISNSMAPKPKTSLLASAGRPCTTSGAVYGVIASPHPSAAGSNYTPPAASTRFDGVTAPCTFPVSCSLRRQSANCIAYRNASSTGSRPSLSRSASVFLPFNGIFSIPTTTALIHRFEWIDPADSSRPIPRRMGKYPVDNRVPYRYRPTFGPARDYPPATSRKNASDFAAHTSQRNSRARSRPARPSAFLSPAVPNSRTSAARSSLWLRGSTNRAAFPATSGSAETFDVITATPAAMACATGNPKPSYNDGYTNTSAAAVNGAKSGSGIYPKYRTYRSRATVFSAAQPTGPTTTSSQWSRIDCGNDSNASSSRSTFFRGSIVPTNNTNGRSNP